MEFDQVALEPGTVVHNAWVVDGLLGQGGMGLVYRARVLRSGAAFALKVIRPDLVADPVVRERFKGEAAAWIRLGKHPNVVQALVVDGFRDTVFIGLELIERDASGRVSLADHMTPERFSQDEAVRLVQDACLGLQHAYRNGISSHLDIKPHNLLLSGNRVLVTDFGLAVAAGAEGLTSQYEPPDGTPAFMPPEQWKSLGLCGEWTDVYALGVVLHMLLSGGQHPLLSGKRGGVYPSSARELQWMHENACPDRLDGPLGELIWRCLEKDPTRRFQTISDLQGALDALNGPCASPCDPMDLSGEEWNDRGASLRNLGQLEEAKRCFDKAIAVNDLLALPHMNLGVISQTQGRIEEAISHYAKALARDPRCYEALDGLGVCYCRQGNAPEASRMLNQAIVVAPERDSAWTHLGEIQAALGDLSAAEESFRKALSIHPDAPGIHALLGRVLVMLERPAEALRSVDQGLALWPRSKELWTLKAGIHESHGPSCEAGRAYERLMDIDPSNPEWAYCAGVLAIGGGDYANAAAHFQRCVDIDYRHQTAWANLGAARMGLRQVDAALTALRNALGLDPEDSISLKNLGDVLWAIGRRDDAAGAYGRFLAAVRGKSEWADAARRIRARLDNHAGSKKR